MRSCCSARGLHPVSGDRPRRERMRKGVCVCARTRARGTMLYSRKQHNTVNQLRFNKTFKNGKKQTNNKERKGRALPGPDHPHGCSWEGPAAGPGALRPACWVMWASTRPGPWKLDGQERGAHLGHSVPPSLWSQQPDPSLSGGLSMPRRHPHPNRHQRRGQIHVEASPLRPRALGRQVPPANGTSLMSPVLSRHKTPETCKNTQSSTNTCQVQYKGELEQK